MVTETTVYFPNVPEIMPTNPVVTIVQEVAAYGQQVDTSPRIPVAITLSGYSTTSDTLVFNITTDPENGLLTGTPPKLIYTPATKFEGYDGFAFIVSVGINTSLPAFVTVIVESDSIYLPIIIR